MTQAALNHPEAGAQMHPGYILDGGLEGEEVEILWLCCPTSLPSVDSLEAEPGTGTWVEVAYLGGDPRNLEQGRRKKDVV